jgi:nitrite reductase/ring-hydroxylating ferredoxin subunit
MTRVDHAKMAPRSVKAVYALKFRISEVPPGSVLLMGVVVVFSVEGGFSNAEARCTHRQGPSTEGTFDGSTAPCPLQGLQFDVAYRASCCESRRGR